MTQGSLGHAAEALTAFFRGEEGEQAEIGALALAEGLANLRLLVEIRKKGG